jgi:hypothetical protein
VAELAPLLSTIHCAAESVLAFIRIGAGTLEITGCWAKVSAPGALHPDGHHPNSFLSGGSYVDVANGADTINLTRGRSRPSSSRHGAHRLQYQPSGVTSCDGEPDSVPASLPHSVDANRSERERIGISFNSHVHDVRGGRELAAVGPAVTFRCPRHSPR